MTRRRRQALAGLAVGALLVTSGFVAVHLSGAPAPTAAPRGDGEMPTALAAHMEKLRQAMPGSGGMAPEGPGSAAVAEYLKRAYPADAISLAQADATKAAVTRAVGRPLVEETDTTLRAAGGARKWVSVGPSRAVYPFTPLRNAFNYVPNEYVAGGRTTSITLSPRCGYGNCRAWITPAGGGIWRTENILAAKPKWKYLGGPLGINAAGAVSVDTNDRTGNTVYVGTGEANICGSGCAAGVGLYKSTNGGNTWTGPLGKAALAGKGIGEIVVKPGSPKTIYVATTTALTGMSSTCCSGVTRPTPGAAKWGLYKSLDGGKTFTFIHNGSTNATDCTGSAAEFANTAICSPRGVRHFKLDPSNPAILYAGSYARGIWRSPDEGATWTQIKPSLNAAVIQTRPAFDVTKLANGKTRMYVHEGNIGTPTSRLFRSDDVATGAPTYTDLTSPNVADPGYASHNLGGGQSWYDLFVYTPPGHPDVVYAAGAYVYGETIANKRGVILSTDAGVSGTDMTFDGTDMIHPNGLHPDQHDIITHPNNPFLFFEANDGGVMRSSGQFVDRSSWCDDPNRGLDATQTARCKQMLSRVPSKLESVNDGLNTLQFMSLSVDPRNVRHLQGGTQDNGTWENKPGNNVRWDNTIIGDGGQSGFDAVDPKFRLHTYFDVSPEVNFNNGATADWIWTADPLFGIAGNQFYAPVITDPKVSGTMFAGTARTVHRTKTFGLGTRTMEEAQRVCNTWTGTFEAPCGDWVELGPNRLTDAFWGDREAGAVAAVERTPRDTSTAWAATTTGRVFLTKNVDADDPAAVAWIRVDDDFAATPNRFVSSIFIDPADGNHAWISYSGYDVITPTRPGHVFEVRFNPVTGASTWTNRSYDLGDIPITDLVYDSVRGDLYASNDFGVLRLKKGKQTWTEAGRGLPNVEVPGLTIVPGKRVLYAATHGLSAWRLDLR
ncbi:MAG TPA: exo-alpha-sialidase [Pilimelia sp.]|nr:exo-alpha-sialidase [Pilimelia sp.]